MRGSFLGLLSGVVCLLNVSGARADLLADSAQASFELDDEYVTGIVQPTSFAFLPDGRMVITEKGGRVIVRSTTGQRVDAGTLSVDTESEKGLLNVLPHPEFASNRRLFLYYSLSDAGGGTDLNRHRVSSIELGADNKLVMASLRELVANLRGPANHDGGALAIGPDGKLYIGVGDTGCNSSRPPDDESNPTNYFGTCLSNANGKILRVELDGSIPNDNPFVGDELIACGDTCGEEPPGTAPARAEIWAWGFRNPWRFWFDPQTGNLWVGDVGEISYEEINVIPPSFAGRHFGWPWREGTRGYPVLQCQGLTPGGQPCVEPAYVCRHSRHADPELTDTCESITGGVIVDACTWPASHRGRYYFGDNAGNAPRIWSVQTTANRASAVAGTREDFVNATGRIVHFATGADEALYYAVYTDNGGHIGRVAPKTSSVCDDAGAGGGGGQAGGGNAGTSGADAGPGSNGSDDDGDGCGCRTPGTAASSASGWLAVLGAFGALALRVAKRRRARRR